jgi:PKHD-type hydroxylase
MIICLPDVLTPLEVKTLRQEASLLPFVAGSETAGKRAQRVKNNEQLSQTTMERKALHDIVLTAFARNRDFNRNVLPKRVRPPLISRYRPGMSYGKHVDSALMGPKTARDRSDVSITVFLSDMDEYEGGDLLIHGSTGSQRVKLPSGSAVVYPSTSLHEVTEVTRGERLVAVTWAQSYVRDDMQRQILAHLAQVKDKLNTVAVDSVETDLAHYAYANLLRMWAQT